MSELTPRELRQMAKQGNVQAMFDLGSFYSHNGDFAEAVKWYEMAAKEDIPAGMLLAAEAHMVLAAETGKKPGSERRKHYQQAHNWFSMLRRCVKEGWSGTEQVELEEVLQGDAEARYHIAAFDGVHDRREDALRLLEGMDDRRSQVLRAVIEYNRCKKAGKLEDGLYHTFHKLAEDRAYAEAGKDTWEENAYVIFVQDYLDLCCRGVGQPDGEPNLKEVLRILTEEKKRTKDPENLKDIEEDLQTVRGEIKKKQAEIGRQYGTYLGGSISVAALFLLAMLTLLLRYEHLSILLLLGFIGFLLLAVYFRKKSAQEQAELEEPGTFDS